METVQSAHKRYTSYTHICMHVQSLCSHTGGRGELWGGGVALCSIGSAQNEQCMFSLSLSLSLSLRSYTYLYTMLDICNYIVKGSR